MKSTFFLKYSLVGIAFTTLIGCKNAGNKDADKAKEVSTTVLTLHTVEMSQTYILLISILSLPGIQSCAPKLQTAEKKLTIPLHYHQQTETDTITSARVEWQAF